MKFSRKAKKRPEVEPSKILRRQEAIQRKYREAEKKYEVAKESVEELNSVAHEKKNKLQAAKKHMLHKYDSINDDSSTNLLAWRNFNRVRAHNETCLDLLRNAIEDEQRAMEENQTKVVEARERGDEAIAMSNLLEKYEREEVCGGIQAEIDDLIRDINDAKERAEIADMRPDGVDLQDVESEYEEAKADYDNALRKLKQAKAKRNRLKREYKATKAEYVRLKKRVYV